MSLFVCALADVEAEVRRRRPDGVVSLLSPGQSPPACPSGPPRLILSFHDIAEPAEGFVAPDSGIVARLLAFDAGLGAGARVLAHCWMGISRSPAAAYILACARRGPGAEDELARALRQAAPSATPNPLLVRLADAQLERRGRMSAAVAAIGRGSEATIGQPFELGLADRSAGA